MVSEKLFRERCKSELRQIGNQVQSLATDRDVYWKVERDVILPNLQLHGSQNPFLDLLRGNYCDAMPVRALWLLDGESSGICLPRVLEQIADRPEVLLDKITERELAEDRAALARAAEKLKATLQPRAGHHERTLSALAATHRELDSAIDLLTATLKTYYWIVADSHLDLDVSHAGDPLEIFRFPWANATVAR